MSRSILAAATLIGAAAIMPQAAIASPEDAAITVTGPKLGTTDEPASGVHQPRWVTTGVSVDFTDLDLRTDYGRWVLDQPGVIADITAILRDESVSLESMLQHGRSLGPNQPVPVVLVTHETEELAMRRAADKIGKLKTIVEPPNLIRIEDF